MTESKRGQTASQARDGLGHYGLNRVLTEPATRLTMCTLEYGTFDRESGQKAFRADAWLHKYGDPLGREAGPIRAAIGREDLIDDARFKAPRDRFLHREEVDALITEIGRDFPLPVATAALIAHTIDTTRLTGMPM